MYVTSTFEGNIRLKQAYTSIRNAPVPTVRPCVTR
jgi:hypothetical protein